MVRQKYSEKQAQLMLMVVVEITRVHCLSGSTRGIWSQMEMYELNLALLKIVDDFVVSEVQLNTTAVLCVLVQTWEPKFQSGEAKLLGVLEIKHLPLSEMT